MTYDICELCQKNYLVWDSDHSSYAPITGHYDCIEALDKLIGEYIILAIPEVKNLNIVHRDLSKE